MHPDPLTPLEHLAAVADELERTAAAAHSHADSHQSTVDHHRATARSCEAQAAEIRAFIRDHETEAH